MWGGGGWQQRCIFLFCDQNGMALGNSSRFWCCRQLCEVRRLWNLLNTGSSFATALEIHIPTYLCTWIHIMNPIRSITVDLRIFDQSSIPPVFSQYYFCVVSMKLEQNFIPMWHCNLESVHSFVCLSNWTCLPQFDALKNNFLLNDVNMTSWGQFIKI